MSNNLNTNAATLIVAAAKKAGLLGAVAEALCFINKHSLPAGECCDGLCRACAVRDALADKFDESICTPAAVLEDFYGDGVAVGPFTKDEIAPYLGTAGDQDNPLGPEHCRMRAFDRDLIRGGHYGQRSCEPRINRSYEGGSSRLGCPTIPNRRIF